MNKQHYVPDMMGCSDGGCIFHYKEPGTMVTNGGCSCMRELQRTEEGFKAVRLILYLRRELNGLNMPFAGYPAVPDDRQLPPPRIPTRTMLNKVNMIKEIREKAGCGLKEAKEAMDAVYYSCTTFDQVIELGVLYALRPKGYTNVSGYCRMGDNCLCGGDIPAVREGCFEWKRL